MHIFMGFFCRTLVCNRNLQKHKTISLTHNQYLDQRTRRVSSVSNSNLYCVRVRVEGYRVKNGGCMIKGEEWRVKCLLDIVVLWPYTVRLFIFFFFLVHTISSYQLQIFYYGTFPSLQL